MTSNFFNENCTAAHLRVCHYYIPSSHVKIMYRIDMELFPGSTLSQMMQMRWGEVLYKQFLVDNGVKQGGVL